MTTQERANAVKAIKNAIDDAKDRYHEELIRLKSILRMVDQSADRRDEDASAGQLGLAPEAIEETLSRR